MLVKSSRKQRKGSVLVEYALLIAGVALASVVAVALLGHKTFQVFGVAAAIVPGAHVDDNKPLKHVATLPLNTSGSAITLDSGNLVSSQGVDRFADMLGPNAGESLIIDSGTTGP